ncbi:MAG TPA: hypothetical protein VII35_00640 [Steroidobacteraceae bacterium]
MDGEIEAARNAPGIDAQTFLDMKYELSVTTRHAGAKGVETMVVEHVLLDRPTEDQVYSKPHVPTRKPSIPVRWVRKYAPPRFLKVASFSSWACAASAAKKSARTRELCHDSLDRRRGPAAPLRYLQ